MAGKSVAFKPPSTVISPLTEVSLEEMARRVERTRERHGPLLQEYHKVWYESDHTWVYNHFCGIGVMKSPNDLWMYQTLLNDWRPKTVIETGTYQGGSALWFAFCMEALGIDGRVWTIDAEDHRKCNHPRITFLEADSTDPEMVEALKPEIEYPLLISLDSDHSAEHVRKEMELFAPLCRVDDWLIVEDTNISWGGQQVDVAEGMPVEEYLRTHPGTGDRGAAGGVEDYIMKHQGEFRQDVLCERYLLTMHPGGWLQRVAECPHGR